MIAGPLADVLFSIIQCALGAICLSAGFVGSTCLGSILVISGAAWILGECFYATCPDGDIRRVVNLLA